MISYGLMTSLLVTGLVLVMVFVLPWADRRICRKLGLNLRGGVSANPDADRLLSLRQWLLTGIFLIYMLSVAWIVFFSRSAAAEYQVHIALFEDLQNAVRIDFGFLGILRAIFTEGFTSAMSHIRVLKPEDIVQVYLNVMLFVPMGYLLPYVFRWFRARVAVRPAVCCFLTSLLIENLQLITRRGFYDMDDLVSNTLGGILGVLLYVLAGYVVTHPDWKKEWKAYRRWKRNAQTRTLYPFARRMGLSRTTLLATNEEEIWDFYVMKLGFRLKKQLVPLDSEGTDMLLEMGRLQVEVHCSNRRETLGHQTLTMSARRLRPIMERLKLNGIQVSAMGQDPYTGLRCIHFDGPDGVVITVIEK